MTVSDSEVVDVLHGTPGQDSEDESGQLPGEAGGSSASRPPRKVRPSSAPCRGEVQVLDLQVMTQEAVLLFNSGRDKEALEIAVAFANLAKDQLGRTHPTFINALATVAAFADQMGCSEQAQELLHEAEDLQEEHEMEAMEYKIEQELAEMSSDGSTGPPDQGRHRKRATAPGEASEAFLTGVDADSENDSEEEEVGNTDSGEDADLEDGLASEDDGDEEEEQAEAITRLTFEVHALLKDGQPGMAAELLSEAENQLAKVSPEEDEDGQGLRALTRAALHTLWAAVLENVGQKEKAESLYREALVTLRDEVGVKGMSSSEDDEEDEEKDAIASGSDEEVQLNPQSEDSMDEEAGREKEKELVNKHSAAIKEAMRKIEADRQAQEAFEAAAAEAAAAREAAEARKRENEAEAARQREKEAEAARQRENEAEAARQRENEAEAARQREREAQVSKEEGLPSSSGASSSNSKPSTPAKPKEPPPPPHSKRGIAAKAEAKASPKAVRVGGGFIIGPQPPKAPPPKKTAPTGRKTRAKAAGKISDEMLPASLEPVESEPVVLDPVLSEKAKVVKALTSADHFLGLLNFERAADLLEEQLAVISKESSPHRGSDLHVEVLTKYAGILWWDGDLEGTLDAWEAADEVLADRPEAEDPDVQRRRTEIWGQLAQVYRSCGALDEADKRLTAAVQCLVKLCKLAEETMQSEPALGSEEHKAASNATANLLREMQASLGQVCVQKKDYKRAEELYLAAFAPELALDSQSGEATSQAESADQD